MVDLHGSGNSASDAGSDHSWSGSLLGPMFAFQGRPAKRLVTGVEISTTSYREVVACCERWLHERRSGLVLPARYICVTSVHGIITAQDDAEFRKILNSADVVTP